MNISSILKKIQNQKISVSEHPPPKPNTLKYYTTSQEIGSVMSVAKLKCFMTTKARIALAETARQYVVADLKSRGKRVPKAAFGHANYRFDENRRILYITNSNETEQMSLFLENEFFDIETKNKKFFDSLKQEAIKNFSGWIFMLEGYETWSRTSRDMRKDEGYVLFERGEPVKDIPKRIHSTSYNAPDRAYGYEGSSDSYEWAADDVETPPIDGEYICFVRDVAEYQQHSYWLRYKGKTIYFTKCELLPLVANLSLRIARSTLKKEFSKANIINVLNVKPDEFPSICAEYGEKKVFETLGGHCISAHFENVRVPTLKGIVQRKDRVALWAIPYNFNHYDEMKMLLVHDTTKQKDIFIPVPPEISCSKAALMWTFGNEVSYEDYALSYLQS